MTLVEERDEVVAFFIKLAGIHKLRQQPPEVVLIPPTVRKRHRLPEILAERAAKRARTMLGTVLLLLLSSPLTLVV